jgi:hypothetical protein
MQMFAGPDRLRPYPALRHTNAGTKLTVAGVGETFGDAGAVSLRVFCSNLLTMCCGNSNCGT